MRLKSAMYQSCHCICIRANWIGNIGKAIEAECVCVTLCGTSLWWLSIYRSKFVNPCKTEFVRNAIEMSWSDEKKIFVTDRNLVC